MSRTWAETLQARANLDEVVKRTRHSLHLRVGRRYTLALCVSPAGPPLHLRHPKTGLWVPAEEARPDLLDRFLEWANRPLVEALASPLAAMADFTAADVNNYYLGAYNASYATTRSTFNSASSGPFLVGQQWRATPYNWYQIERGVLCFDTTSIDDAATVSQVNQTLTCTWDDSMTDFDVQIVKADWAPMNESNLIAYVSADDANYDLLDSADRDSAIWRNTSGMSLNTPYTSGNLSTAWIRKTDYTRYGYQNSREHAAQTPPTTGNIKEQVELAPPEHATASYRPILSVLLEEAGPVLVDMSGALSSSALVGGLGLGLGKLLGGEATLAGALGYSYNRAALFLGDLSIGGEVGRSPSRTLEAATLASTGSLTKAPARAVEGEASLAGEVGALRLLALLLEGALAAVGTLAKRLAKLEAGSLAGRLTGTLRKQPRRGVGGSLSLDGIVAALLPVKVLVEGALATAGTLGKALSLGGLLGRLTTRGAVKRDISRLLDGALEPSGALDALGVLPVAVAGALESAGALGKTVAKSLAGSLASRLHGGLIKQPARLLDGALSFTGVEVDHVWRKLGKLIRVRRLGGTLTTSGAAAFVKQARVALAGALSTSGRVGRDLFRGVGATLSLAGTLGKDLSLALSGALDLVGAANVLQTIQVAIDGALGLAGSFGQQIGLTVRGFLVPTGALLKRPGLGVGGVLGTAGAYAQRWIRGVDLDGTLETAGSVGKSLSLALAGALESAGELTKSVALALDGAVELAGELTKEVSRAFSGVLLAGADLGTLVSEALGVVYVELAARLDLAGARVKLVSRNLDDAALVLAGAWTRQWGRVVEGTLATVGDLTPSRVVAALLAGALGVGGALSKQIGKRLGGTLTLAGSIPVARLFEILSRAWTGTRRLASADGMRSALRRMRP